MTDAVAIGHSANYQLPLDAVLCNHPAADLQNLNNNMLFQPDAISLSEASICSSMETWTTDLQTNASSDTQSTELLTQSHPGASFCYNNGMEQYILNNSNQVYTEELNANTNTISQQWDCSSSSISAPYSYCLQQQPNNVDHSSSIWLQGSSSMTMPQPMPYSQTIIPNQIQFDPPISPEPRMIDMYSPSSSVRVVSPFFSSYFKPMEKIPSISAVSYLSIIRQIMIYALESIFPCINNESIMQKQ